MRATLKPEQFADPKWRLNNLYKIVDKDGNLVPLRLNRMQWHILDNIHYRNIILKARQLGVSTFISVYMLDKCLFNSNVRAGTVCHDLASARGMFRDKVKGPYENLPDGLRILRPSLSDSAEELLLGNNSSLRIATSLRSGTYQLVHISEFGAICARFPDKAREVITGSLNTLAPGMMLFIELTAEGQEGKFYELCQLAQTKQRMGSKLGVLDLKSFFFPWFEDPRNVHEPFPLPEERIRYFDDLKSSHGIILTEEQKAWYAKTYETQMDNMGREFPSLPEEAFAASLEGTFYGKDIALAETEGRIGSFPAAPFYAVHTAWDIGMRDSMAIWFWQFIADTGRIRFIGYYECNNEGFAHYADKVDELSRQRRWPPYGLHFFPDDVAVREPGSGKTRIEQLVSLGIKPSRIVSHEVYDGINGVRKCFKDFEFDEAACAQGLKCLRAYRRDWDEQNGRWRDKPKHDWASHAADALRYAIMGQSPHMRTKIDSEGKLVDPFYKPKPIKALAPYGPNMVGVTLQDIFEDNEMRGGQRRERRI